VPYKGIREATANLLAGDIDLQVSFFGEVRDFIELGKIYALGVTGPNRIDGVPTLISQGFAGMDQVVNMHSILAPATMPSETATELKQLMARASKDPAVLRSYETDRCKISYLESTDNDRWFATQQQLWKQLSDRAKIAN
jgi:putative tricarboxylic transport membrane protein